MVGDIIIHLDTTPFILIEHEHDTIGMICFKESKFDTQFGIIFNITDDGVYVLYANNDTPILHNRKDLHIVNNFKK